MPEASEDDFNKLMDINAKGVSFFSQKHFRCWQKAAPLDDSSFITGSEILADGGLGKI